MVDRGMGLEPTADRSCKQDRLPDHSALTIRFQDTPQRDENQPKPEKRPRSLQEAPGGVPGPQPGANPSPPVLNGE